MDFLSQRGSVRQYYPPIAKSLHQSTAQPQAQPHLYPCYTGMLYDGHRHRPSEPEVHRPARSVLEVSQGFSSCELKLFETRDNIELYLMVLPRQKRLPMPTNMPHIPSRSQRRPASFPIRLVLETRDFKADNSAIATDISRDGVGVRTTLGLVPGEWVGYVAERKFPRAIPSRVVWAREDKSSHWLCAGLEFLPARI